MGKHADVCVLLLIHLRGEKVNITQHSVAQTAKGPIGHIYEAGLEKVSEFS